MPYIANTDEDRRIMLDALGIERIEELFDAVPEKFRYPDIGLPDGLSEPEVINEMRKLAARNEAGDETISFLGGGSYEHFIPAVVPYLAARGEFATAYTPYQSEASQGTLQSIFEYQSMLSTLYGVDVVNASHYDGSTAFAESALMALNSVRKRSRIVIGPWVHPEYLEVLRTYVAALEVDLEFVDEAEWWADPHAAVSANVDEATAVLMVQSPDFFGRVSDLRGIAELVHEKGALLAVHADPISLAIYRSPGELGADIVTGDGQPLGIPMGFGGPSLGIFGCRDKLVRRMPGRLVGETVDTEGRRGFVLTLNTREQHIRRAKATSNICTNQGLMALRSAIHLAALGPEGLKEVALLCHDKSHYAAERLTSIAGVSLRDRHPFFREFAISTPIPAADLIGKLRKEEIVGGIDIGRYDETQTHNLLVCVTEMRSRTDIDRLVDAVAAAVPRSAS